MEPGCPLCTPVCGSAIRPPVTGTPKTLSEAVRIGVEEALMHSSGLDGLTARVADRVRDFLSQRFTEAMLTDDGSVEAALKTLWASCIGTDGETERK